MKPFFLIRSLLVLILALTAGQAVLAQPASGGPAPITTPTEIPLDGSISLLLAGGVAYGIKHLRNLRKKA